MYKVIKPFADLKDGRHIYHVGDVFPHDGKEVSELRIKELSENWNLTGSPLIKKVKDDDNDGVMPRTEELVRQESEEVQKPVRGKKRKSKIS